MSNLLTAGDVVVYHDGPVARVALALRVYPELSNGAGPLADLVCVLPPARPGLYPVTIRRALVHPKGSSSNLEAERFWSPAYAVPV